MLLQGNINYTPWDPLGIVRFFKGTLYYGDIGSVGIFLEILFMPILWLLVFKRITRPLNNGHTTVDSARSSQL